MDVTIEIMREDGPGAGNGSWALGDPVGVFPARPNHVANVECNVPRKCYIIITGFPAGRFQALKDYFEARWVENKDTASETLSGVRRQQCDFNLLPVPHRRSLLNPPYARSYVWDDVKDIQINRQKDSPTTSRTIAQIVGLA